jgi:hypothetical protein
MARYVRSCILCGKKYEYCNTCSAFQDKPVWMFSYCSEDCKDITSLLTDYIYNKISKEEVKEIIGSKDTSRHMQYKGSYGKAYKEIMDEIESEIPEENKTEKDIKENVIKDMANDTVTQLKDNLQSESKKVYPKAVAHKHGK